jgi:hypothetical protein
MKRIVALVAAVLAIASVTRYEGDRSARNASMHFLSDFDVALRHPEIAATIPLVPAADLGAEVIGDVTLADSLGSVNLADATPELRGRWLRAIERVPDELTRARAITLDALATRPGWPEHWAVLGEIEYASQRRVGGASDFRRWEEPLRTSLAYFPGSDAASTFLSTAYLENWPSLTDAMRSRAVSGFRRALLDPGFASMAFPVLIEAVGIDHAITLLPQDPATLRAAFDALAKGGDITRAAAVYQMWESSEWRARVEELHEIESRARMSDVERQRELAQNWLARHSPADFDSPAGRDQELRVLQLAVNDRIGPWQSDPRASVVRFFLNRRIVPGSSGARGIETAAGGAVVSSVVSSLSGVPEPIRARARLLGGDVEGAQSIFERSDSAGSFEWTPFLLDLASYRMAQNSLDTARAALEALAPAARGECDSVVVHRRLAALDGSSAGTAIPASTALPPTAWSSNGSLSLCIDPDAATIHQLVTAVEAPRPVLVAWGWNDGRQGILQLDAGRTVVRVATTGRAGRQTFFIRSLTGARITPGPATLEPTGPRVRS